MADTGPAYIQVRNWKKFQHYKQRNPPWIRLYNELLDDYSFARLPDASKWHAVGIWLLASRFDNRIPNDAVWIGQRINARSPVDVDSLVSAGFVEPYDDASAALAKRTQDALPETEAETEAERERETKTETATARETKTTEQAAAVAEMSTDLNVEISNLPEGMRRKLRAVAKPLIDGDSKTSWLMPGGGDVVPWPARPAIFRLALADCLSEDSPAVLSSKIRFHTQRELDPYPSKRPAPDSQARHVTNEMPQSHDAPRIGRATTVGGMDPVAEQLRREREDIERADAWARSNPDAANAITADVAQEMAEDARWKGAPKSVIQATHIGEVRRRILEQLTPRRTVA